MPQGVRDAARMRKFFGCPRADYGHARDRGIMPEVISCSLIRDDQREKAPSFDYFLRFAICIRD